MPIYDDAVTDLAALGARPIPEFEGVYDVWPRAKRLEAIREGAVKFNARFREQSEVLAVRSLDIAVAPYPTRFALNGAAVSVNPMVSITNRMVVVQFLDFAGEPRTLVWEPTVPAGSAQAPFYSQLEGMAGKFLAHKVFAKYRNEPEDVLPKLGLSAEDVDFASFDHLHVQDMRRILGSNSAIEGESKAFAPLFPNAQFIVHRKEVATLEDLHPMQWAWYVEKSLEDAQVERFALIDGDVELGHGVAILWTPGHTDGNHSLAINTPDGVWVSSENGVSADNWQPDLSKIPGVAKWAKFFNREVIQNANTLEDSIDQYDSMVKEKTVADPSPRDRRWKQIQPTSEMENWKRQWPVVPTFTHGGMNYGTLKKPAKLRAELAAQVS
jgi:hypothetical protein